MNSRILLLSLLALVAGCAGPHQFLAPDASWQTRVGQAKFSGKSRTIVGDVTVTTRGGKNLTLDFRKGPGLPLLTVRTDGAITRYEGMLARGSWQGAAGAPAPPHLRVWQRATDALMHTHTTQLHVAEAGASVDFQLSN